MILTITPNPALDETYDVDHLAVGGTNRVPAPSVRAGGKGLNVARVLHAEGRPVDAIATCGGGAGETFAAELAASGIENTLVPVGPSTRRSFALVDRSTGETTIFNEHGGGLEAAEWNALQRAVQEALHDADVVVGSGSLPGGAAGPEGAAVDEGAGHGPGFYPWLVGAAQSAGVPCVIDTSGAGLLAAARAGADVLKPNHHELLEATGTSDIARGAAVLLELGARRVVVSSGEEGLSLFDGATPGSQVSARLPEPLEGNPTGAGDACVAALASGLAEGLDAAALVCRAAAWSASAVLMPAAGELHPSHPQLAHRLLVTRH
ncbi:1-phosphofructokinase family hexose kinase [Arthrobacter rhombi]|uniref:Putative sugar kinase n=1 Tax=Arthrobacter rhombi TaxID=71253 RepID=A0A1R4GVL7_9MICC|nr:PfkB family carbohydrate kinase [Arthrobacter rhombi]SJM72154.1 Putative sugar kinase [Arthrobacter rhombi]